MNTTQQQLVTYARQIAQYRGYTDLIDGLQPQERLIEKFYAEKRELEEAIQKKDFFHQMHEAADILYYAACLEVVHPQARWWRCAQFIIENEGLSFEQAESAALAKYVYRASGPDTKDEEHELDLIQHAIQ